LKQGEIQGTVIREDVKKALTNKGLQPFVYENLYKWIGHTCQTTKINPRKPKTAQ